MCVACRACVLGAITFLLEGCCFFHENTERKRRVIMKLWAMKHLLVPMAFAVWTQGVFARPVFDVGAHKLSERQGFVVRGNAQKMQEGVAVAKPGKTRIPVRTVAQKNPGLVLLNERNGATVVLSGFAAGANEIELTPLVIAELKQSTLGDADAYVCLSVDDLSVEELSAQPVRRISAETGDVKLPIFKYGTKGHIKTAGVGERRMINMFRMKPHFIPVDPSDASLRERIAALEDKNAYYAYTYQMPDGSQCTYDEIMAKDPANAAQNVSVGSSLVFDLNLVGMTSQQQTASQYGAGLWGGQLYGTVPVSVSLLFTNMEDGVLGGSYSPSAYLDNGVYYPSALRNQMVGTDLNTSLTDIRIEFNTQYTFYFGTNMNAGSSTDYVTVLLHEMAHGLGFYDSIDSSTGGYGYGTGAYPLIYDTLLYYSGSRLTTLSNSGRYSAIRSAALYFDGTSAKSANGGSRIKLYAPSVYDNGSSVSHWDTTVTFSTFMKYAYAYPLHTIGTRKLGLMKDIGWTLASDVTSPPSAPANVSASDNSYTDKVRVTWTASSGATSYKVYRSTSNNSSSSSQIGTSSASPYDDVSATAGTTYYYWVKASNAWGDSAFSTTDSGSKATSSAPANDNFANALTLSGNSGTVSGVTSNATVETGEPAHAGRGPYKSVWYKFTPSSSGKMNIDTHGSSFDTVLAIYSGSSVASLTAVASNDDDGSSNNCSGTNNVSLNAGTTYQIAVAGYGSSYFGPVVLNWMFSSTAKSLSSVSISGSSTVTSGNAASYTCTATYSDSSTATVTPTWSLSSTTYATITSGGLLTAKTVTSSQSVTVQASYTEGGVTKTATKTVTINPSSVAIAVTVPAAGGSATSSSLTNDGSTWTFDCTGRPSWITSASLTDGNNNVMVLGTGSSGLGWYGAGTVSVSASANTTGSTRSWTLPIATSGGTAYSMTFSQEAVPVLALEVALDNTAITWTTGGDADWYGQAATAHDGVDAAQSGLISHNQTNWVQTTVIGPGTLYYWWNVSSEAGKDKLVFIYDGAIQQEGISGTTNGWTQQGWSIPSGVHTLRWSYLKDGSGSSGVDCGWVDQVSWTPFTVPDGMSASDGTSTTNVSISWSKPSGASSCQVFRALSNSISSASCLVETTASSFSDDSATPGTLYYYWVRAYYSIGGLSDFSSSDTGYCALAAPTRVVATDSESDAVTVTWSAVTGASYYRVYSATSSNGTMLALGNWQTALTYSDTLAVVEMTNYYWVVASVDNSGTRMSAYSSYDTGTRSSAAQVEAPVISPTNGTVFTTASKRVTITCATSGAEIRFTTNGVDPTVSNDLYAGSFNIYATTTVKARAFKSGLTDSVIVEATITKPLQMALADALDVPVWTVATGGDASWIPENSVTHDGADAVRTGAIGASQTTWLETSVSGAGTLSFWWQASCEDSPDNNWDFMTFTVNGVEQARVDGDSGWRQVSVTLPAGSHTLRWTYSKDDADETVYEDCGWVDQVVWTQAASSTTTTEVPVPYAWLDTYGLVSGGDYEAAAHDDKDGDGLSAWQEYVAGTVPTNGTSVFQVRMAVSNSVPLLTWVPDLGAERAYTVEGKASLADASWSSPTNAATRFFRVKVSPK